MILLALLALFLVGMFLSAFFSGSETGFYRVTRVRLVLDASEGHWIAEQLLKLTNRPAMFVATTLVGNNLANNVTSLAIVLLTRQLIGSESEWVEVLVPLVMCPFIFVYGELLPKNLFYYAPNLLLRRSGPLFLMFSLLFAPISLILYSLGRLLEILLGQTPLKLQPRLARKELQRVLQEGHEIGLLSPAQRELAENLFPLAPRPIREFAVPLSRFATATAGSRRTQVFASLRTSRYPAVLVRSAHGRILGYLTEFELHLQTSERLEGYRPVVSVNERESHLETLLKMHTENVEVALIRNAADSVVGVTHIDDLVAPMLPK